jgi:hypothetical protein
MIVFTMLFIGLTSMPIMIGYTNNNYEKGEKHYVKH